MDGKVLQNGDNMMAAAKGGDFAAFLNQYAFSGPWRAVQEESGMNNTTRMVYAGGSKYVLRVYDNHRDADIVLTEHAVLLALARTDLPVLVPKPVASRSGGTVTAAPDGKLAALYRFIEGRRPSPENPHHIEGLGRAAGELTMALRSADIACRPIYKPYYEFEETHCKAASDAVLRLAEASARLSGFVSEVDRLLSERARLAALRDRFAALPAQWIHGDIVFNNAVAQDDRIVGLLDFEFSTVDARAMELAVILGEFPEADGERALKRIGLFCSGYGSAVRLTGEELEMLPELVKLRMMDVFLHFAGRLLEGLDPEEVWEGQIKRASFVFGWMDKHRGVLETKFDRYLAQV
jgi:homoserine kinase type II